MRLPWMPQTERRLWRSATTLTELGGLMARWLEGDLTSWPGYQPRCGPDGETRDLVPALAAACRAGYVTIGSQPGHRPLPGFDGLMWSQRPAVQGFVADADLLRRLIGVAETAGLTVLVHDLLDPPGQGAEPATLRGQAVHTAFGGALGFEDLEWIWRGCSMQALDAVADAAQVTVIDPAYADDTCLWDVLTRVAAGASPPEPEDDESGLGDWVEPPMTECRLCGARYPATSLYCSEDCRAASADDVPRCETDEEPCDARRLPQG